jgi:hypothetical protein
MTTKHIFRGSVFCLFVTCTTTLPLDDHFFRASWSPTEPRFERNILKTIELPVRYGSSHSAYNCHGHKTNLFDLYGTHALAQASKGVIGMTESNSTDKLFLDLTQEAAASNDPLFGTLSFDGKERLGEFAYTVHQNFYHGLFLTISLPVRVQKISELQWHDLTNPDAVTPTWSTIKNDLPRLLCQRYSMYLERKHEHHIECDAYFLLGWTHNNENTTTFDFVDTTLQAGFLVPNNYSSCSLYAPFILSSSANDHCGFPLRAALSGGLFEWLTIGGSFDATFYTPKYHDLRLKTAPEQRGLIVLDSGTVKLHQGALWNASTYFKVDHIAETVSLMLGYSYAKKTSDSLCACNERFAPSVINSDPRYRGWNMHTLHFVGEYDFSQEDKRFGPRVGLFYDKILAGESIVNNSMGGGLFGLEVALDLP